MSMSQIFHQQEGMVHPRQEIVLYVPLSQWPDLVDQPHPQSLLHQLLPADLYTDHNLMFKIFHLERDKTGLFEVSKGEGNC